MTKTLSLFLLLFIFSSSLPTLSAQSCIVPRVLSQGSNAFSQTIQTTNPIAVDPDLNTIVYIHRQDADQFAGNSGALRFDFSTDGGQTWTVDQGVLNSINSSPARYPQVALYNPPGNTNPLMAYLAYQAPTNNAGWNGHVTGVSRLDNTNGTESYNQAASTDTRHPRGMMARVPGEFWSVDAIRNGNTYTGFRVLKGTWSNGNVNWITSTTLNPNFNGTFNHPIVSDYSMAWDPSGQFGWIGIITDLASSAHPGTFQPAFYRTTDGGQTWSGPEAVDLNDFPCITSLFPTNSTICSTFELNLTVDIDGNLHALVEASRAASQVYEIESLPFTCLFDLTYNNGIYTALELERRYTFRGVLGPSAAIFMDANLECSRSPDGSKLFFFWTESNSVFTAGENDAPDLYGLSLDVVNRTRTAPINFTGCDPNYNADAWFPQVSPIALPTSNSSWVVPGTIVDPTVFGNDPNQTTDFVYLDKIAFDASDYTTSVCENSPLINSNGDLCSGGVVLTTLSSGGQVIWSTGDTSQSITVTQAGTYTVTVSSPCCLSGSETVVVSGDAPVAANFSWAIAGMTYDFADLSAGPATSWAWDFGDGNTSSLSNPSHTFATAGIYDVCLVSTNSCGSDTFCEAINVLAVGLDEGVQSELLVYPNPSNGLVTVQSQFKNVGNLRLSLLDLRGKEVDLLYQGWTNENFNQAFDMTTLPAGVYFLRYELGEEKGTVRILRQ